MVYRFAIEVTVPINKIGIGKGECFKSNKLTFPTYYCSYENPPSNEGGLIMLYLIKRCYPTLLPYTSRYQCKKVWSELFLTEISL